jgi:hypothetical protein
LPDQSGIGLLTPTHTYDAPGEYTAALQVTDTDVDVSTISDALVTITPNQETVALNPLGDSWVDRALTGANHGTEKRLRVQSESSANNRTLIMFDLSSIPAGAEVDSAILKLFVLQVPDGVRTYGIHRVTSFWEESGVTWGTQPTVASNYTDTVDTLSASGWMDWDVPSDVDGMVSGTIAHWGWLIEDANEYDINNGVGITEYASRERDSEDLHPILEVSYHLP